MGLVMFARYGEDSPLDKGYVKTNDQVDVTLPWWSLCCMRLSALGVWANIDFLCADGAVFCDGRL